MKAFKFAAVAALLTLGTVQLRADQTNIVETIQIRLLGLKQGATTSNRTAVVTSVDTVRLDNRQVIRALGSSTGNSFSPASRLVLVTPMNGTAATVQVRDGNLTVDVTGHFALEQLSTAVTSSALINRTGASTQTSYSIQRFALQDDVYGNVSLHFSVSGIATDTATNRTRRGQRTELNIDAAGSGDSEGTPLVIQGSINLSGETLEVVPDEGPSGPS
jgi:hypothetical protein